jgi:hypothetical protein
LTKPVRLSRRGGELLLRLLEQSTAVITAAALEELQMSTLINLGALERHGAGRAALVASHDGPTFRDLIWQADQNAYGYFDASDGSVVVAPEAQLLFRVALPRWLTWLAASLTLTNSGQPTELVPASAWDIGDFQDTSRRTIPVLFVRRLHREATLRALQEALQKRTGRSGGLILTSSRNPLQHDLAAPSFVVVPIWQAMTNDPQVFAIDRALLISGGDQVSNPPKPVRLQPARKRARDAIRALHPNRVPDQADEPNAILCRKVSEWLTKNQKPQVSDPTILRAAGRRKEKSESSAS